jgi:hypothetical protein
MISYPRKPQYELHHYKNLKSKIKEFLCQVLTCVERNYLDVPVLKKEATMIVCFSNIKVLHEQKNRVKMAEPVEGCTSEEHHARYKF